MSSTARIQRLSEGPLSPCSRRLWGLPRRARKLFFRRVLRSSSASPDSSSPAAPRARPRPAHSCQHVGAVTGPACAARPRRCRESSRSSPGPASAIASSVLSVKTQYAGWPSSLRLLRPPVAQPLVQPLVQVGGAVLAAHQLHLARVGQGAAADPAAAPGRARLRAGRRRAPSRARRRPPPPGGRGGAAPSPAAGRRGSGWGGGRRGRRASGTAPRTGAGGSRARVTPT